MEKRNDQDSEKGSPAAPDASAHGLAGFLKSWRYFIVFLAFGLLIVLFYAEENWRGKWAWNSYRKELGRRGGLADVKDVIPKPVPLSENFATTPFLSPLFEFVPGTQKWRSSNAVYFAQTFATRYDNAAREIKSPKPGNSNSWVVDPMDLPGWYAALLSSTNTPRHNKPQPALPQVARKEAATGVLQILSEYDPVIEELRDASKRRYSRFELKYDEENPAGILLPHLGVLRRVAYVLQLRASAELSLGQVDEAGKDIDLILYLSNATKDEPVMVSQLMRVAPLRLAVPLIAEGMHLWTAPQLQSFQTQLLSFDFCADMQRAMDAERVFFGGGLIDYVRHNPEMFSQLTRWGSGNQLTFPGVMWAAAPNGWFDLEKRNYNRAFDVYRQPGLDLANRRISPSTTEQTTAQLARLQAESWPIMFVRHRVFSALLLPAFSGALRKTAFAQTQANLAGLACAIERYRRAAGKFPGSLQELTPTTGQRGENGQQDVPVIVQSLPLDIINGEPLEYRIEDNGYVLYSVGWNEKDDGGKIVITKGEGEIPQHGDWVWRPMDQ